MAHFSAASLALLDFSVIGRAQRENERYAALLDSKFKDDPDNSFFLSPKHNFTAIASSNRRIEEEETSSSINSGWRSSMMMICSSVQRCSSTDGMSLGHFSNRIVLFAEEYSLYIAQAIPLRGNNWLLIHWMEREDLKFLLKKKIASLQMKSENCREIELR